MPSKMISPAAPRSAPWHRKSFSTPFTLCFAHVLGAKYAKIIACIRQSCMTCVAGVLYAVLRHCGGETEQPRYIAPNTLRWRWQDWQRYDDMPDTSFCQSDETKFDAWEIFTASCLHSSQYRQQRNSADWHQDARCPERSKAAM